ncbi:cation:proton antiporter [Uliginosibacterium gangwonense]|uniref:cation:proton antiporter n=1 Tax=Uliginosibacterium gangwonense TaxID=392736 RepID=UPI000477F51D|nr:cation:proton antiporter [Uliginosibacterium gangwonense]
MSIPFWSLFIGILMITMLLVGKGFSRLLLSNAMIYLGVGYVLGPGGLDVVALDPLHHAQLLEGVAQIALLISLFTVGLKMGGVPLLDRRWILPLRLAFVTMAITVGLIAVVGVWGMGFSLGAAILLGGILAPTDPVLASGVQTKGGATPDHLRFSLAGEGGLNDGSAFPFVLLGLGLLGKYDLGSSLWHWWGIDVFWSMGAGLCIGAVFGALIGRLVVRLRTRHQQAVGLDEFLSLGLMAVAYGAAQICMASGFLAVFAAGLALQRVQEQPRSIVGELVTHTGLGGRPATLAVDPNHASAAMSVAVQGFNEQLEKLAELAIVLLVGVMLPYAMSSETLTHVLWWFIPLLFVVLRTLAVSLGMLGERSSDRMAVPQRAMISWFGIRGIGSVFYLMFAIRHGVSGHLAQQLVAFTLMTVAASIVVHGVSVRLLMKWYMRRKAA